MKILPIFLALLIFDAAAQESQIESTTLPALTTKNTADITDEAVRSAQKVADITDNAAQSAKKAADATDDAVRSAQKAATITDDAAQSAQKAANAAEKAAEMATNAINALAQQTDSATKEAEKAARVAIQAADAAKKASDAAVKATESATKATDTLSKIVKTMEEVIKEEEKEQKIAPTFSIETPLVLDKSSGVLIISKDDKTEIQNVILNRGKCQAQTYKKIPLKLSFADEIKAWCEDTDIIIEVQVVANGGIFIFERQSENYFSLNAQRSQGVFKTKLKSFMKKTRDAFKRIF